MTDISEFESNINQNLNQIANDINNISKKEAAQRKILIKKIQLKIKTTSGLVEAYEFEIDSLDPQRANVYKMSLNNCKQSLEQIKNDFEFKKNEDQQQQNNELFGYNQNQYNNEQITDPSKMSKEEMIQYGDKMQDEGVRDLEQIEAKIEDANRVGDEILLELDKQIEQLDRIRATNQDNNLVLKRTQRLLRYFGRVMHTDKIIMGLMGCVCLAILICIVLSATGLDGGQLNTPDQLPSG